MSVLGEFLKAKEPLFDHSLRQLELRSGQTGVDVALTAEIATKSAHATEALGLSQDCTGEELYAALLQRVKEHDTHFARQLGGTDPENLREMLPLIVQAALKTNIPRDGFFLKEAVATDMLLKMPPTAIMERLGYSDVKTLLATEDIFEIFLALRFGQDADWLNTFNATYKDLKGSDFEVRDIRLVPFNPEKWGDIAEHFVQKKLHNITNSKEIGAIAVMPMTIERMPGISLKVFPLIMHYYNEIRLYSAFFKLVKDKKNFGEVVATTLIADPSPVKISDGPNIHWRVIQRYFGKLKNEDHPEIFEPHLQPEDLHWRKAEHVLYEVSSELKFWKDMDYVAVMKNGEPVTFALMDISLSYSNGITYQDRYLYHFRESLWNEVFARYLGQKNLEEQLLTKLDNALVAPEELTV